MAKSKQPRGTKAYKKRQRGASHAGFHYHNLYQCCQLKWFMKYVLRIEPNYTATPLLNGAAFHEGKATFYKTGSKAKAIRKVETELKGRKQEFYNDEQYLQTSERCPILLENWIEKFGWGDLKRYDFIAIEEELEVKIPGTDYVFTIRPDAVVQEKTGDRDVLGMETKTSSFSIKTTDIAVYYGDQATAYLWAAQQHYKRKIFGIVPDIAYWNKQTSNQANITCTRGDIVRRDERRIYQFYSGLAQLINIMSQKVAAYESGADPYMLFQRNTHYCNAFFKPCEYAEICDNDLTKVKRLPPGYRRDRAFIKPKMTDPVLDSAVGLS